MENSERILLQKYPELFSCSPDSRNLSGLAIFAAASLSSMQVFLHDFPSGCFCSPLLPCLFLHHFLGWLLLAVAPVAVFFCSCCCGALFAPPLWDNAICPVKFELPATARRFFPGKHFFLGSEELQVAVPREEIDPQSPLRKLRVHVWKLKTWVVVQVDFWGLIGVWEIVVSIRVTKGH